MRKLFLLAGVFVLMSTALHAQVTIGVNQDPNPDAVLELTTPNNNRGFLPPRIALVAANNPAPLSAHVEGMIVYNTTVVAGSLAAGLYVNDGTQWVALHKDMPDWFYMPSFPLNIFYSGDFTVDLWQEYNRQFNSSANGSTTAKNPAAPLNPQSKVYEPGELYYYVTGYDTSVFSAVSLTDDGKLKYSIDQEGLANVSDDTFMNIVLVVK